MSVEKANRTWHAGKPKKKPDYDREEITEELLAAVVGVYEALDEYGNHPSLRYCPHGHSRADFGYFPHSFVKPSAQIFWRYRFHCRVSVLPIHRNKPRGERNSQEVIPAKLRDMLIQLSDEKKLPGKDEKPEDDNKTEE